jgi:sortase B
VARRIHGLAEEVCVEDADGKTFDWGSLESANPDVVAWLRVEGTPIDTPVVQRDDSWYLSHDFYGEPSGQGCPFLAMGASPDAGTQLVYGHHFTNTDLAFSTLAGAWQQGAFDGLGGLTWTTPDGGTIRLRPLCALRVDETFSPATRTSFADDGDMRSWLVAMREDASASSPDAAYDAEHALRVVTLVTCSSDLPGQRWRTVVVFVATDGDLSEESKDVGQQLA